MAGVEDETPNASDEVTAPGIVVCSAAMPEVPSLTDAVLVWLVEVSPLVARVLDVSAPELAFDCEDPTEGGVESCVLEPMATLVSLVGDSALERTGTSVVPASAVAGCTVDDSVLVAESIGASVGERSVDRGGTTPVSSEMVASAPASAPS